MRTSTLRILVVLLVLLPITTTSSAPRPAEAGDDELGPIIDIHTHVFNLHYLPLEGILVSRHVPRRVAKILAGILEKRTTSSDFSRARADVLSDELLDVSAMDETRARDHVMDGASTDLKQRQRRRVLNYIADELRTRDLRDEDLTDARVVEIALEKARLDDEDGGQSYFRFLALLTKPETTIVRTLVENEYPDVGLFVHHMMDMERAYNDRPVFDFENQQVLRMRKLEELYPGQLLGFVAFDPFRRKDAMQVVTSALDGGALGVKFYPPSGYRAANNEIPDKPGWIWKSMRKQWRSRYSRLSGDDLNRINEELFAYCAKHRIPILAHCSPVGFQAAKDYGKMSNPDHWEPVLDRHPDLILLFAHAGGGEGWFAEQPWADGETFDEKAFDLATSYEHVYLGFGYFDEILEAEKFSALQRRLERLVERDTTYPVHDKLVYGTDWHMVASVDRRRELFERFYTLFDSPGLRPHRNKFFRENAARYLNLAEYTERHELSPEATDRLEDLLPPENGGGR